MAGDDVPQILLHLNHQVANLKMEVFDVATGRSVNFADDEDFIGRNSAANTFFAFPWDGTTMRRPGGRQRTLPNGTYRIDLSVLKALGDPRNPAHFERWSSPPITIARPTPTTHRRHRRAGHKKTGPYLPTFDLPAFQPSDLPPPSRLPAFRPYDVRYGS
jgi:hypothetical protein